jgi:hypothetical protein
LIAAAQEAREVAQQAVHRFERPATEVQIARAELAALKSVHDTEIASWYEAGCSGDHPQTPLELLRLEHQVGELACNVGAVENRLVEAHEALQRENVHLAQLQLRHCSTTYRAVTEAAQARLYAEAKERADPARLPARRAALHEDAWHHDAGGAARGRP